MSRNEYGTTVAQTPSDVLGHPVNKLFFNVILIGQNLNTNLEYAFRFEVYPLAKFYDYKDTVIA